MSSLILQDALARHTAPPPRPAAAVPAAPPLTLTHVLCGVLLALLAVQIPWADLRGYEFVDRVNYLHYFKYEENLLEYSRFSHWYDYLTNEILWHSAIPYLHKTWDISLPTLFDAIAFFCVFTFVVFLARYQSLLALPLLLNPLLMTFAFDQMRNSLAFSLLLWAFMLPRKLLPAAVLLVLIAPFLHTSSVLFVLLWLCLTLAIRWQQKGWLPYWFYLGGLVFAGAVLSFASGELLHQILSVLGDRRAERVLGNASSGLLYTLFWIALLGVALTQGRRYGTQIICAYAIVILSFVSFNLVFGGYSLRFLAASLPMLIITMLRTDSRIKPFVVGAFGLYACLQWYYWLKVDGL